MASRLNLAASFYGGPGFSLYHAVGHNSRIPMSPHFHDEYLIAAQLGGEEKVHVAGKLHELSAGDVVLINPQQVHTGNAEGDEVEYISLYVDRETVERFAAELGAASAAPEFTVVRAARQGELVEAIAALLDLVQRSEPHRLFPTPQAHEDDDVVFGAKLLPEAPAEPGSPSALEIETALHGVLSRAFEEFSNLRTPQLRSTNRVGHRKIARAVEFIRDLQPGTPPDAVTLDKLAEVAGLSKYHFLRQFSQVVGMTPGAYLRTLRLCHAARLLRSTTRPIVDIALAVGFSDHPSFSRAFARYLGLTPSEYRRLGPI